MEKIDACKNGCMLYWKDDIDLEYCKFCGEARYKPTREYNPNRTKTPYAVLRRRRDPCATRLMRRRGAILAGHTPILQRSHVMLDWVCALMGSHRMGSTVTRILVGPLYLHRINLPPGMCMNSEYMFLTMAIPGPSNPKRLIDIYLELLIEELQNLWHVGVLTRDSARDETFAMRVTLMWTVNDLPAYGMASGWFLLVLWGVQNKKAFTKNRVERKVARPKLTGEQIRDWVEEFSPAVEVSLSLPDGYGIEHKWTKKSIFWELEY
ncbi:UNVERIFIED_CONTAM: hypothetical protein Slati_3916700 [Sesamum latifolium]|uniref:Uncharacterized protein n=1 Tax=Sesamum latifolium TaxID=2727402 RepID=A0AAW2TND9_9LAMI